MHLRWVTHPQEVRKIHEEAQMLVMKAGLVKVAEIIINDGAEMQLDSLAKTTQFPKKSFKNKEEAETCLSSSH